MAINRSAKGRRNEHKSIKLLESLGYSCIRSAASKGAFDIVALSSMEVLLIQVKSNSWPSSLEVEAMRLLPTPTNSRKLIHQWKDGCSLPLVKEL
jgi:Holliday junction resolvase